MRYGLLTESVVIHFPNFFGTGSLADVEDVRVCNAVEASAETEDDFVGEPMGDDARVLFRGSLAILLGEHLGALRISNVVEPALHAEIVAGDCEVSEGDHCGIRRRRGPTSDLDISGRAELSERIEALRNHVEDSGLLEVVPENPIERFVELSGVRRALEVGDGDA